MHPWTSLQPLLEARLTQVSVWAALKCRRSPSPDRVRQCGAQVLDEANARVSDCPDRPCETFKERRQQLVDALQAFDECVSWVVVWVAALRARELKMRVS